MLKPNEVAAKAKQKETKNIRFRTWLKNHADPDDLDARFKELHEILFRDYDCTKCGNCCRNFVTAVEPSEMEKIADYLNMPVSELKESYIRSQDGGDVFPAPCPMLQKDGKCRIYEVRPEECSGFPYTDRPNRIASLWGVLEFAEVCPVVYEIVERLKESYRFR